MCKAICRGIMKEKMQRELQVRAALEVGEGVHKRIVNTNESHDDEIEAGAPISTDYGLGGAAAEDLQTLRLNRLTVKRNKNGDVTSALAFDVLTGMSLDAGNVKEARAKEVRYIRDKSVHQKIWLLELRLPPWKPLTS